MNNYIRSAIRIIVSLAFLNTLYACDNNGTAVNTTSVAQTEIPAALQKLIVADPTALTASLTVDGGSPKTMLIDTTSTGSASVDVPGLTLQNHTIVITYSYTVGADTAILATATKDVDLSVTTVLGFLEIDYIFTYDFDGDGTDNATELALIGRDLFVSDAPVACVLGTSTLDNCIL